MAGSPLGGQSGGSGTFLTNAPWEQNGGNAGQSVDAASLNKPGLINPPVGGSVKDDDVPTGCCSTGRIRRVFSQPWVGGRNPTEGTFYIGYLANWGSTTAVINDGNGNPVLDAQGNTAPDVHFRAFEMWNSQVANPDWQTNPDSSVHLQLGYSTFGNFSLPGDPNGGQTGGVAYQSKLSLKVHDDSTNSDTTQVLNSASPLEFRNDGMTHCIVFRFDLSKTALSDRVRVYLDPMGMTEPAVASADISGVDFTADSLSPIDEFVFNSASVGAQV